MLFDNDELGRAIFFVGANGKICKEIHESEFQAILDGYVPILECKNRDVRAVYVEMDSSYTIHALVFFRISFTQEGAVEPEWSLPLDAIARDARDGPDLGAGPIRLACASQCPVARYASFMWEPDLHKTLGIFTYLKRVVSSNKLSIQFRNSSEGEAETAPSRKAPVARENPGKHERKISEEQIREQYAQELRSQVEVMFKAQRQSEKAMVQQAQQEVQTLQEQNTELVKQLESYQDDSLARETEKEVRNKLTLELEETKQRMQNKIEGLREYFEHKLEKNSAMESAQMAALQESHETEMRAQVQAVTELIEILKMREGELLNRNEREHQLLEEIARLQGNNRQLPADIDASLMEKMMARGVSFMTYQPGSGPITIPGSEMYRYLENPDGFVAEISGVTEEHYKAWLSHYQAPVCTATDETDSCCSEDLERISAPQDFKMGESDRCEKHKQFVGAMLKVIAGNNITIN